MVATEYVKSGVLNEEMRRRTQGTSSHPEVLMIERGRSKTTSQAQNNRGRSRSKSKPRYKDLECHFCVKTGHVKRCYKWKKENHTSNGKHEKKDNDANSNRINTTSSDDLLVVYDENLINLAYNETNWVVDSGASFHVPSRREFFTSYTSRCREENRPRVESELQGVGTGSTHTRAPRSI